jgi:hypothetical protein
MKATTFDPRQAIDPPPKVVSRLTHSEEGYDD